MGAVAGRIWRLYDDRPALLRLGGGRLPDDWHDTTELARAIRRVAREGGRALIDYGTPLGNPGCASWWRGGLSGCRCRRGRTG
ncbi:hypothetical protein ACFQ4K_06665 [Tistrella bauzanensis]